MSSGDVYQVNVYALETRSGVGGFGQGVVVHLDLERHALGPLANGLHPKQHVFEGREALCCQFAIPSFLPGGR